MSPESVISGTTGKYELNVAVLDANAVQCWNVVDFFDSDKKNPRSRQVIIHDFIPIPAILVASFALALGLLGGAAGLDSGFRDVTKKIV